MRANILVLLTISVVALAGAVHADVSISGMPTQNMSCDADVCTATAQKAVLNVNDLQNMLASGDVAVKTGSVAKDIDLDQPLSWTATSRLTLDAQQSVSVKKQVTVAGQGALTITTNDGGGKKGDFIIVPEHGSVQFWDLGSSLIIEGNSYTLVADIKSLADGVAAKPDGFFALARPYDASPDGVYSSSPIGTVFAGAFEGLGNAISNLTVQFSPAQNGVSVGLFSVIDTGGAVRDLAVLNSKFEGVGTIGSYGPIGLLVGDNRGLLERSWTAGTIMIPGAGDAYPGGLAGQNDSRIADSHANVSISAKSGLSILGGLVAFNDGDIVSSYALGGVSGDKDDRTQDIGGLVGRNLGHLQDAFARGAVHQRRSCCESVGGLVGINENGGQITTSYAGGYAKLHPPQTGYVGGLVGIDDSTPQSIDYSYWDLDRGVSDPAQGAGNIPNDPGITGLSDAQLKSGLPDGFDPKIWGQSPNINNGYPYLLANPPR